VDVNQRIAILQLLENELTKNVKLKLLNDNLNAKKLKLADAQKDIDLQQRYQEWIRAKVSSIKGARNEWDKKVAAELNGPIQTIYRRLNRHSNFYEIDFKREGRTNQLASLGVQSKGKNLGVANVLSAGQLSTVALSVFFTVAFSQWQESFRCYFMDDPIQSMDDLNVLSFVDMLRTELGPQRPFERRFADQLFLTTCNGDLENLIKYKMRNFGVNICHVKLKGYGSKL
jgi:DNA repair protein SbcC/Rad50